MAIFVITGMGRGISGPGESETALKGSVQPGSLDLSSSRTDKKQRVTPVQSNPKTFQMQSLQMQH